MNIEKLIKNEANEKTPELFSDILNKAGAEGLIPQSEVDKYKPSKKPAVKKGVIVSVVAALTVAAAGLGIGLPVGLNSNAQLPPSGADSSVSTPGQDTTDPGTTPENPDTENPDTDPEKPNTDPETPVTPHEHVYGEWKFVVDKTCEADGLKERECECGEKEQEIILKGHEYASVYSHDGSGHWYACTECGDKKQEVAHKYGEWKLVTAKSCTVDGLKERECECGEKEQQILPKGHENTSVFLHDDDYHWKVCPECVNVMFKEAHTLGEWTTVTVGSCKVNGVKERACACGYKEQEITSVEHTYVEEYLYDNDSHWFVCSKCGDKAQEEAHVYGEWDIVTAKSCDEDGLRVHYCECGRSEQEVIAKGHDYKYTYDYNEHWYICSGCGDEIEKEEHDLDGWNDCKSCSYHEVVRLFTDTNAMNFSLVNGEFWALTHINWEFMWHNDLIDLHIPAYWQDPNRPELGTLPVRLVGAELCKGNSRIRYVTLPETITEIMYEAFADMPNLKQVGIGTHTVKIIGSKAFANCIRLKEMYLPETLNDIGLAPDVFDYSGIEELYLPSMDYLPINDLIFVNLNYDRMPSLKRIGINGANPNFKVENNALYFRNYRNNEGYDCKHLVYFIGDGSDIDLSAGYHTIEPAAFRNKQLADTELYLPEELECIYGNAFENCNVKILHFSERFAEPSAYMAPGALTNAHDLTEIYFAGTKQRWEAVSRYNTFRSGVVVHCTDGDITY